MKQMIVDTNAFLRFLLDDIPEQKKTVERLLKQAEKSEVVLLVPQIVVFELQFILDKYYHFDKDKIIESLSSLIVADFLSVESKKVFIAALKLYTTENISFVDCFLIAKAQAEDAEIFTFDQKLKKIIG